MADDKIEKKKTREVRLTVKNQISLEPGNPVPINFNSGTFGYVNGRKYIPFLGVNDNLPGILLEARMTSVTQNNCITGIAESVVGKGLQIEEVTTPNQLLVDWFKNVNNDQQSINELIKSAIEGERTFGNQFIEIKVGSVKAGKTEAPFMKVYNHSMRYTRFKEPDDYYSRPTSVIISRQFDKNGQAYLKNAIEIPLWSPNPLDQATCWKDNGDGTRSTMIHFKNELSGYEHYGMPASIAGLRYCVEESKLVQFNIDNLDNNLVLGGMLILKSAMTRDEAEDQAKEILMTHIGEGKTGRIAVVSSESGLDDVKFEQFNTQKEGSFKEREATVQQKIIIANNYNGALLGIEDARAMGRGSSYIRGIYDLVDAQLLSPLERKVIDKVLKPIIKIFSEVFNAPEVVDYTFNFEAAMPYSMMSDLDSSAFTKVKEARALAGFEPDDVNGEKYLSEMKSNNNPDVQANITSTEGANNNG